MQLPSLARRSLFCPLRPGPMALAALLGTCALLAAANPLGGTVVNGQASMVRSGNQLLITNAPGTIINWQSFSIGAGELTRFVQQGPQSSVLNRITGQDPSQILGALQSNGRVFLLNPNGILFGAGSRVDVNGLFASTLNLSNEDFLAGKLSFVNGGHAAGVQNQGAITTPQGGQVVLIAPDVANSGLITSPGGAVLLAAGQSVHLADASDPAIRVVLSAPADRVLNVGSVLAEGGKVGIYAGLIKQRGRVSANSAVRGQDGRIVFKASGDTLLEAGSQTTATGAGTGGEIQILGERVALTGDALVDASGHTGGGTVLVGGDYQGGNSAVSNARQTLFGSAARIRADAIDSGDGGKVILWSDAFTRAYGSISARGGARSGNGGFVETSGKQALDFRARVDVGAAKGQGGTLLLDPTEITIVGGVGDPALDGSNTFSGSGTPGQQLFVDPLISDPMVGNGFMSTVYQSEIEGLAAGTNVILEADNAIFATGFFTNNQLTLPTNSSLTLRTRSYETGSPGINLATLVSNSVPITLRASGVGAITAEAGLNAGNPAIQLPQLQTAGGAVRVHSGGSISVGAITTTADGAAGGAIDLTAGTGLVLLSDLSAGSAVITLHAGAAIQGNPLARVSAQSLSAVAASGIALNTVVASLDAANTQSGDIAIGNTGALSLQNIDQSGGGAIRIDNTGALAVDGAVSSDTGAIELRAHSPLTVNGSVSSSGGGSILLVAGASGSTADLLTIGSTGSVSSAGPVVLQAGDAIRILAGGTVTGAPVTQTAFLNPPTLSGCVANPVLAGCAAVLPTLPLCTSAPSTPGCSVVLPTLSACIATPAAAGCGVVLPALSACVINPAAPGCVVVLPSLSACVVNPTAPGCAVVLPTLSACTSAPSLPGCAAVLPSLAACIASPTTSGCVAVLPTLAQCSSTPSLAGCVFPVVPDPAPVVSTTVTAPVPLADICTVAPDSELCRVLSPPPAMVPVRPITTSTLSLLPPASAQIPNATPLKDDSLKESAKDSDTASAKTEVHTNELAKKTYCN